MIDNRVITPNLHEGNLAVLSVILKLRPSDKKEIMLATGKQPAGEIIKSWNDSIKKWVVLKDDTPVALFGVDAVDCLRGSPWFVATEEIGTIKAFLLKNSFKYINEMKKGFNVLSNVVSAENKVSINWLKWCGFTVGEPIVYGPFNSLFCPFRMCL